MPLTRFFQHPAFRDYRFVLGFFLLVTVVVTIQHLLIAEINNYYIFKYSFPHLIHGQDLYALFPGEYYDNYKYGPVFAVFIAPAALLPDWLGLHLWTIANTLLFFWAIYQMPIADKYKVFIYWAVFLEFLTATQNVQANPALTAFIVLAFVNFERKNVFWAAFWIALGAFFKVYGLIGAAFFLLYPQKIKFIGALLFWSVVLFLLPAILVPFEQVVFLYKQWYAALVDKVGYHTDASLMRIIRTVIYAGVPREAIMLAGVAVFCLAYLRRAACKNRTFRLLFLSSILIWMVIFSPGAESATYIMAVTGVAVWYAFSERKLWQTALLVFVLLLTCMSPSDLFPRYLRETYVFPYGLKALPCAIVWFVVMHELLFRKFPDNASVLSEPVPAGSVSLAAPALG